MLYKQNKRSSTTQSSAIITTAVETTSNTNISSTKETVETLTRTTPSIQDYFTKKTKNNADDKPP